MKRRTLYLSVFAVGVALVGAGVVYTTGFDKVGQTGAAKRAQQGLEQLTLDLEEHVRYMTIDVGERPASKQGAADEMLDYLVWQCGEAGYQVEEQQYKADGRNQYNVVAEKKGQSPEILLIGCHYDGYRSTPSADATASSVAALLEIMGRMRNVTTNRTLRFAFFGSGEAPYRGTEEMGARVYAKACREAEDPIEQVIMLDSIGYYSSEPGSQQFIFPWNFAYPTTGDFVGVFGTLQQRKLVGDVLAAWRRSGSSVAARGGAVPHFLTGIRSGDHIAFEAEGFPAIVLTDTGNSRHRDIRTPFDNYTLIDYESFAPVVVAISDMIVDLASR